MSVLIFSSAVCLARKILASAGLAFAQEKQRGISCFHEEVVQQKQAFFFPEALRLLY